MYSYARLQAAIKANEANEANEATVRLKLNNFLNPSIYGQSRRSIPTMVAPAFGWSAGDIVTSIKILIRISEAFKDAGGAVSQFAETTAFLDTFEVTLRCIKDYTFESANAKYTDSIIGHIKVIDGPYSKFEKYMLEFCPALGEASTQSKIRKVPKKVKWALRELSDVSGEVGKLKRAVTDPMLFIGPLLLLQAL